MGKANPQWQKTPKDNTQHSHAQVFQLKDAWNIYLVLWQLEMLLHYEGNSAKAQHTYTF